MPHEFVAALAIIGVFFVPGGIAVAAMWMKHRKELAMIVFHQSKNQGSSDEVLAKLTQLSDRLELLQDRVNQLHIEHDSPRQTLASGPAQAYEEEPSQGHQPSQT